MLRKISLSVLFLVLTSVVYAEEQNNTVEDQYAACEKAYDNCLLKCEDKKDVSSCTETCDEELDKCNHKVLEQESN